MGGSHLPADILKTRDPYLPLQIHKNYQLPPLSPEKLKKSLLVAISHSGNTKETISFANEALKHGYNLGIITTDGKLLEMARENKVPYIKVPTEELEPRHSLGYMTVALSEFVNGGLREELETLSESLNPSSLEEEGKDIFKEIKNCLPVFYASERNQGLAYIWKIKINETSKAPAFWNTFPELNHNELAGFDMNSKTKSISKNLHFIFLEDPADPPEIKKRAKITKEIYESKGLPVSIVKLNGKTPFEKIFNSLILSDWVSLFLAEEYGTDPFSNELVEEFKKRME